MIYENDCTLLSNKFGELCITRKRKKYFGQSCTGRQRARKFFPYLFVRAVDAIVRIYSFFARISHMRKRCSYCSEFYALTLSVLPYLFASCMSTAMARPVSFRGSCVRDILAAGVSLAHLKRKEGKTSS